MMGLVFLALTIVVMIFVSWLISEVLHRRRETDAMRQFREAVRYLKNRKNK